MQHATTQNKITGSRYSTISPVFVLSSSDPQLHIAGCQPENQIKATVRQCKRPNKYKIDMVISQTQKEPKVYTTSNVSFFS